LVLSFSPFFLFSLSSSSLPPPPPATDYLISLLFSSSTTNIKQINCSSTKHTKYIKLNSTKKKELLDTPPHYLPSQAPKLTHSKEGPERDTERERIPQTDTTTKEQHPTLQKQTR
jgi:hypothetical protein